MTHPAEARIRAPSDEVVYSEVRRAFRDKTDEQIIAELVRMIVFVAISWNDVVESGESAEEVLHRQIFHDVDELSGFFPWSE